MTGTPSSRSPSPAEEKAKRQARILAEDRASLASLRTLLEALLVAIHTLFAIVLVIREWNTQNRASIRGECGIEIRLIGNLTLVMALFLGDRSPYSLIINSFFKN